MSGHTATPFAPDAMRADDDLDRPLFFEPSGDGMRACIHDADGYIFCEANYDDFKDPSFPERVMKRLVERASTAPVPLSDDRAELVKALEEIFAVGHGSGPNTHERPAATTGEGHARCRDIAERALATLTARKVG